MEREIKFRAWDKKTNRMYPEGFDILGETTCFNLIQQWLADVPFNEPSLLRINDIIIMQFIGLLDRNGKWMYESDIIRMSGSDGVIGDYEIVWHQECCCFMMGRLVDEDADTVYFGNSFDFQYEVVGNIYENPELLNS